MKKLLFVMLLFTMSCSKDPITLLLKPYRKERPCHKAFFQKIAITKYHELIAEGCDVDESIRYANQFTHNIMYVMARDQPQQLERNICKRQGNFMRGGASLNH